MREMFCFQCQQTAHNTGCDGKAGVCGKKADTANYQDELIGALIGLARAARAGTPTPHTDELILKGLFTRELDPMYPYLTYQDFLDACGLTEEDLTLD